MNKNDLEIENLALKQEIEKLRNKLEALQQRNTELELLSQPHSSMPVGDLVEVDDGYCLYSTSAIPMLETVVGDNEVVPALRSEEEGEASTNNTNILESSESYLHQLSQRGPVRIFSCRSTPLSADLFNNEVQTTNAFGINAVLNFLDVWDQWILIPVQGTNDKFAFRSSHGFYLCAEPDGNIIANRKVAHDWEYFTACDRGENKYAFRSYHGKYLCAEPDGKVVCNRECADRWETFEVKVVS